ncbi:hypothetical protein PC110_g13542 [Phytophthora cactorum]|uniref:Uncharacterized protein n=2 Tax=Phytophthora cactorum TaxID=29920 RepID=A0A329S2J9_9STRA|nr:hypothetical protein PC110_g13542 [Phytophthora cactorum]
MRKMPLHEVEDTLTRAVKKCMEGIAIKVGHKLEKELGALVGLVFDAWTHCGVHYVVLNAVYEADGALIVSLLGLSPHTKGTQTADAHVQVFENILDVYNKTNSMVGFLVGDNCSTNQSIAMTADERNAHPLSAVPVIGST